MRSPTLVGCLLSSTVLIAQEPPAPGRLVDLGGWRMHIHCTGETRPGRPTVVLIAGSSGISIDWVFVQKQVATFARVCSYDRSGTAWSDLGPYPHTLAQKVFELHLLLQKSGEPTALVLVGHSYGGRLARLYASTHPADVKGMVLVDAGHEDSLMSINGNLVREWELATGEPVPPPKASDPLRVEHLPPDLRKQLEAAAAQAADQPVGAPFDKLPPDLQRVRAWATAQVKSSAANNSRFNGDEILALKKARAATLHPLGDIPLVVLTRGIPIASDAERGVEREEERLRHQADLATLSRQGRQRAAARSTGHHIHVEEPEIVVDAVRQVVRSIK
jgi:pimeloyl-ACP methyl ester carboxylesterase